MGCGGCAGARFARLAARTQTPEGTRWNAALLGAGLALTYTTLMRQKTDKAAAWQQNKKAEAVSVIRFPIPVWLLAPDRWLSSSEGYCRICIWAP